MTARGFALALLFGCAAVAAAPPARADVGAPVELHLRGPLRPAVAGLEFDDTLVVVTSEACALAGFQLQGQGWTVLEFSPPQFAQLAAGDSLRVRFRAIPADPDQPLELTLNWLNGPETFTLDLSPRAYDLQLHPGQLLRLDRAGVPLQVPSGALGTRPRGPDPDSPLVAPRAGDTRATGGRTIRVHGSLVYTRPDGKIVGADGVSVRVYDEDTGFDELLATGITGVDGGYDISFTWDPCWACDGKPDLYVEFACTNAAVDVRISMATDPYDLHTNTVEDYTGSDLDFGVQTPTNPAYFAALHIQSTVTRAWRWLRDGEGFTTPKITYVWPEGVNAAYHKTYIHISPERTWADDTYIHELGHHWVRNFAVPVTPDYCNTICDSPTCGHCMWCPETDHDAWSEGFPNWLADVITRSFEVDYGLKPLNFRDQDTLRACGWTPTPSPDPWTTEGFLGALLHDIEDTHSDDHFPLSDAWRDALALGTHPIFQVASLDGPTTPLTFIARFRARYPAYKEQLWETAKNCLLETDLFPPGPATGLHSTSHTIGLESPDPRVTIAWTRSSDDASGIWGYAVSVTSGVADPGTTRDLGDVATFTTGYLPPGSHYINLRAQDRSGKWSTAVASIGPIVIRAAEPANLTFINPLGWDNVIVPRATADATSTTAHLPAELPGNATGTYWNVSGVNNGESVTLAGFDTALWLDGLDTGASFYKVGVAAATSFTAVNMGPVFVPGGRHTLAAYLDSGNALAEPIEPDNVWGDQYVWSPVSLVAGVVATRPPPPDRDGGWDQVSDGSTLYYNSDGLRFTAGGAWNAVAAWCTNKDVDDDLRLHARSSDPSTGFDLLSGASARSAGCVDAVIVNGHQSGVPGEWDVGVVGFSGPAVGYAARHVTSVPVALGDSVDAAMGTDDYVVLREVYVSPSEVGPISVWTQAPPGSAVTVLWLDAGFATGGLSNHSGRAFAGPDGRARLDVVAPNAGYYCVAIYRDPKDVLPAPAAAATPASPAAAQAPALVVGFKVVTTYADLVTSTPSGWHAPVVPRPAADGTPGSVPAPVSLDGNIQGSFFNIALENAGPTPTAPFTAEVQLDGAALDPLPMQPLQGNTGSSVNDPTPWMVRGGRHTLSLQVDPLDAVAETDESNNAYGEQWVWSPLALGVGESVTRAYPPDPVGGWEAVNTGEPLWYNCDGLRVVPPQQGGGAWLGVAAMPGAASDVDLLLGEVAQDTKSGFAEPLASSGWGPGQSDFVLVQFGATPLRPFDVGVVSGGGIEDFTAEAVGSVFRGNFPSGYYGPFTLAAGRILDLHEFVLLPGRWRFQVQNLDAQVNWGLSLYPETGSFFGKSSVLDDAAAWLEPAGLPESFVVDVPAAGSYALAVWKSTAADLPLTGQYQIYVTPNAAGLPTGAGALATSLAPARPNPFTTSAALAFELAGDADVDLGIHDVSGARVRTLARGFRSAGRHVETWDGTDDGGNPVRAGVYLARFTAPGATFSRKLVLVH